MILVDGVVPSWYQIVGMFSFWERNIQIRTVAITVFGPTFVSGRFPDFLVSLNLRCTVLALKDINASSIFQ